MEFAIQDYRFLKFVPYADEIFAIIKTIIIVAKNEEGISKAENISVESFSTSALNHATPALQEQTTGKKDEEVPASPASEKSRFISEGIIEIKITALLSTMNKGNMFRWNVKE